MSFDSFYHDNYWKAYGYLVNKGMSHHDAEEVVQEVFMYCYHHFDQYDPNKGAITTWLYVIVTSRFKNYCRDRKLAFALDDALEITDDCNTVERAAEIDEMRQLLADALKELPETQRKMIVFRYFGGMTTEVAAQRLGVTPGNARVILSRGLKAIRLACSFFVEGE